LTPSKERRARRTVVDGRRALDRCLVRDAPLGILACVPIYEYKCRKCKKRFEELVKIGETPQCPRCHDPNPEQLFSMTAAVSTSTTREKSLRIARGVARSVKREKDHADAVYHSNYIKEHSEPAAPARTKQAAAAARKPTAASKRTAVPKPTKNRRGK
jgi:putative FmdB family regulatory protein